MNYDPELVDYDSPWFEKGWEFGKQYRTAPAVYGFDRQPEMSDVDWASFCEAILMSRWEDVDAD